MPHENNRTVEFRKTFVDTETEGGKIANRCGDQTHCIRGHLGYMYYRIDDKYRAECPLGCCLNRKFSYLNEIYPIEKRTPERAY